MQKKVATGNEETKKVEEKTKSQTGETKLAETRKTITEEEEEKQEQESLETLAREATTILDVLSTLAKPKGKRKRQPSMYFKARKSTRIKAGKPQPPSKEPIIIEDVPTATKEDYPSKTPITYERGSPKTSTWKERIKLVDSNTILHEVQTSL